MENNWCCQSHKEEENRFSACRQVWIIVNSPAGRSRPFPVSDHHKWCLNTKDWGAPGFSYFRWLVDLVLAQCLQHCWWHLAVYLMVVWPTICKVLLSLNKCMMLSSWKQINEWSDLQMLIPLYRAWAELWWILCCSLSAILFLTDGSLMLSLQDKASADDFLGGLMFDLTEVPQRKPPESPLPPQWYKLEAKNGKGRVRGTPWEL